MAVDVACAESEWGAVFARTKQGCAAAAAATNQESDDRSKQRLDALTNES